METVEGGIHGEELWGVEGQSDGGESKQEGENTRELQNRIHELEEEIEKYKKALEESIQEPEANRLMELVEQVNAEKDNLTSKCQELEGKLVADGQFKEELQAAIKDLETRLKESEQNTKELDKELGAKSQTELGMLGQLKELQDELTKALEALKDAHELKEKLQEDLETSEETQRDLEREKGAVQKQLNDTFLQISALKVSSRQILYSKILSVLFWRV